MRILAFSDLHRDLRRARRLAELASEADVVAGAGDFASFRMGLDRTIDALRAITVPTILVPGNAESDTALRRACTGWSSGVVLHGEGHEVDGMSFFGVGGGVPPTPFPWSFDLTEEEAEEALAECPDGAVLVVHSPPKGYLDEAFGRHLGSEAILRTIEAKQPRVVLCGHIHQEWGHEATVAGTRVVNLGPEGTLLEI